MTALELLYNTDNKLKQHTKLEGINIPTSDIEMFLNNAQELLIRKYNETFQKDEESRLYLQKLIRTVRYDNTTYYQNTTNVENGYYFPLPSDLKFIVMEEASQTKAGVTYRSRVESISNIHFNLNDLNPFKKPYEDLVWRMSYGLNGSSVEAKTSQIITGTGFTLVYYYVHYIKYQVPIVFATNTTSELDETCHYQLIDTAVDLILEREKIAQTLTK